MRQSPFFVRPSRPPKTSSIDISGSMASTDSTRPRLLGDVVSVTQALNEASLAPAPRKLITTSSTMTAVAVAATTPAAGTRAARESTVMKPNSMVDTPQRM